MGKKKDKAKKSKKKKSEKVARIETEAESIEYSESEPESEPESIQYAEYVTAADVMELINSLEQGLDQLDKSNRALKEQIAQQQATSHNRNPILKIIVLILGIGIIAVGYSSAKINSRVNENMGISSTDMDKMTSRINTMSTSIDSVNKDINKINTSLGKLFTNVSTIKQNVNKVASEVSEINTDTSNKSYDTRRTGRPMDYRAPWR